MKGKSMSEKLSLIGAGIGSDSGDLLHIRAGI